MTNREKYPDLAYTIRQMYHQINNYLKYGPNVRLKDQEMGDIYERIIAIKDWLDMEFDDQVASLVS